MASQIKILEGIEPKKYFPDSRFTIDYAFTLGKKHYFRFNSHINIPYQRGLQALVYYREVEMNTDRAYLQAHTEAVENVLRSNPIDVFKIKMYNDQLRQRLQLPKDPELMYKLASIVFFDQHENPEVYEFEKGAQKIAEWKEAASLEDFFLQQPLKELIPFLRFVGENLRTFSRLVKDVNTTHLEELSTMLSPEQKMTLYDNSSLSLAEIPQN